MRKSVFAKRAFSLLLCLCMVLGMFPPPVFAADTAAVGLCEHHTQHTADCGYAETVAGQDCTHEHSEDCYAIFECVHTCTEDCDDPCTHECTVENGCITVELDCQHTHGDCSYTEGTDEIPCGSDDPDCDHTGDCGYVPATEGTPCDHVCEVVVDSEESCYQLLCAHKEDEHDDACGYVEAVEGSECAYHCDICWDHEDEETAPVCDCGTDDESIHATTCAVYVAPENPQCFCTEKCTEVNEWCDVCGFDYTQCGGTDTAATYDLSTTTIEGVEYYQIGTAEDLYAFAALVNNGETGINAILTANIVVNTDVLDSEGKLSEDVSGFREWTPIGSSYNNPYSGTFDGDGHTISGLYFNNEEAEYVGLFGYVGEDGTVQNVSVVESYFYGNYYVGGVVGRNYGTVTNCTNTGTVDCSGNSVGGVVGYNYGTVTNCSNSGTVIGNNLYVGGVVGSNGHTGIVRNCHNTGAVSGSECVGGVVGWNYGTVTNCTNTGTVDCSRNSVGGVVGWNEGTVTNCHNTGTVDCSSNSVGGVVGENYGIVTNCYNTGKVTGSNSVGGVVGSNWNDGEDFSGIVTNCYNTGAVSGSGVVGYNSSGTVTNCYYLSGTASGGIAGSDEAGSAEVKDAAQFASGEVAWLLNDSTSEGVWKQNIDLEDVTPDAAPNFTGGTVYKTTDCDGETPIYSNTTEAKEHSYNDDGFCSACGGYQPAVDSNGDSYYEISNAGQLYWFAKQVNDGDGTINGILTDDITVNTDVLVDGELAENVDDFREWTPIGSISNPYTGTFDGDNHTISGLYFNDSDISYVGLFGYVGSTGTVQNVGVVESYFYGNDYVGGVVGVNESGTVTNCSNSGAVTGSSSSRYVGGVVGENVGTVTNCYNTGAVTGSGYVGGVVGYNSSGTVENCSNTGDVSGSSSSSVGGVVGKNDSSGTVENCYNTGDVTGSSNYVGGVVGYNSYTSGPVTNCYYLADSDDSNGGKTEAQFASGEVAYLLNGDQTNIVWYQTCDVGLPAFSGETVYRYTNCDGNYKYTNEETLDGTTIDHYIPENSNGFCSACGGYESAVSVTADNYESLELTKDYIGYYAISNAGQLYWFAKQVNDGDGTINGILTDNITVNTDVLDSEGKLKGDGSGFREWTPIGNSYNKTYSGTFEGNSKTISGLYFNKSDTDYVGLFGYVGEDGTVQNVGVVESYFYGKDYVGGVVGENYGTVTNCSNSGAVTGSYYVGGVVGENYGTVTSCSNSGAVTGSYYVGGVVGYNGSIVTNCYNTGKVIGSGDSVGGVVGYNYGTVTNCYNTGTVEGFNYVGGVVGENYGTVTNCYNTGAVTGNNDVGGVAGYGGLYTYDESIITNCYYFSGTASGGIAGSDVAGSAEVKDADQFASGEVAYLLNGNQSEIVWYQTCNVGLPAFTGETVYRYTACDGETIKYTNEETLNGTTLDHSFPENSNGFCSACGGYQPAVDSNGDGYYEISNAGQLYWFAKKVNDGDGTINGILTANIVVNTDVLDSEGKLSGDGSGFREWTPIGNSYNNPYSGTFEGNSKTISGLYFNNEKTDYVGLFGYVDSGGTVQNVGVIKSFLHGNELVGGVVGYNDSGTVTNCYNTGAVTGTGAVGGVVGQNFNGAVKSSYNTGSVIGSSRYVGGVVGQNFGTVTNCYNTGKVIGSYYVGGVVGYNYNEATVTDCYYLTDCAKDGNSTTQNGIGAETTGSTTENVEGSTTGKTETQFASGEVAYLLNGDQNNIVWYQTCDVGLPAFTGNTVYRYTNCDGNHKYTNEETLDGTTIDHYIPENSNGFCSACGGYEPANDSDGDGYYEIANAGNLYWFAKQVNDGDTTINGILTDDITVNTDVLDSEGKLNGDGSGFREWTPIDGNSKPYSGTFDGDGHTISGLYFNKSSTYAVGLFGYVGSDGTVQNVGVVDSYIDGGSASYIGGVVGRNYGTVTSCYNTGSITGSGNGDDVGGVVGANVGNGKVTNCYNTGTVTGSGNYVGGVVGYSSSSGTVTNCYNTGKVIGSGSSYVGGVVGKNNGTVTNCYNTVAVTGSDSDRNVGGVVGYNIGTVENCYNTETVTGNNTVGGVVGSNSSAGIVTNCYNTGTVTGSGSYVGGVVGKNNGTVTNCYYLTDCAKDGNETSQNGIGAETTGSTTENVEGSTAGKTKTQFASGEVAYLLNGEQTNIVWYQTCGEGLPAFTGKIVYRIANDGCLSYGAYIYSNNEKDTYAPDHSFPEDNNGFCPCGEVYESAVSVTEDNYESLELTEDYIGYYAISNAGQLYWFAKQVNDGDGTINGILTDDITVNTDVLVDGELAENADDFREWTPIGSSSNPYTGIFDGDGKTISGPYFNNEEAEYVGLFGYVGEDGTVQNVSVVESYFYGSNYVGGVVGYSGNSEITNCYNTGTVTGSGSNVGGVVGYNLIGTVTNCSNSGAVTGSSWHVGGVVGFNESGTVENCTNSGAVTGTGCVGGVVGDNYAGAVENCYNTGDVTGTGTGDSVGGVVGYSCKGGAVKNSYNTGDVTGNMYVGGVMGDNSNGTVANCYYLTGCAKDGNETIQNGIGAETTGSTTADVEGSTTGKTETQFASGEVAWLLQSGITEENGTVPKIWGQNLDNGETVDKIPNFTGATVYGGYADCQAESLSFSNTAVPYADKNAHVYDNGICGNTLADGKTVCSDYESATQIDESNRAEFGFTDTTYDGYYAIGNAGQLMWFAKQVNSGTSINGVLTDNINLSNVEWTPIGNGSYNFTGTFDGGNYTVQNLTVIADSSYAGLFGNVSGTVKNLTVYGTITVTANKVVNIGVIGNLTGTAEGINSYVNISVNEGVTDTQYLGGVVGRLYKGTVKKCAYYGQITLGAASIDQTGGVVGYTTPDSSPSPVITDCGFYGTITTTNTANSVGGILGYARNSSLTLTNCLSVGTLPTSGSNVTAFGTLNAAPKSISGLYYKEGSAPNKTANTDPYTYKPGDGVVTAVSADQLASGEVAYLLNGSTAEGDPVWGQNLDNGETVDVYPTLAGATVYQVEDCVGNTAYSNTDATLPHKYANGFCEVCGAYQSAVQVTNNNYQELGVDAEYVGYYAIYNAGQLYWFAAVVNEGDGDVAQNTPANAILMDNITVNTGVLDSAGKLNGDGSGFRKWTPIGSYSYTGIFEGNRKTISGLYFNGSSTDYVGLFGYVSGTVQNVGVVDSYFYGKQYVGGVVGYNGNGEIANCSNFGTVTGSSDYVGGVVGYNYFGIITSCSNSGTVTGGGSDVGGVVGYNYTDGAVTSCTNEGDVTGSGNYVGGVVGYNGSSNIEGCTNSGTVSGSSDYVGGVVGYNIIATVTNCSNSGTVIGSGDYSVGGVAGYNGGTDTVTGTVTSCSNSGTVTGGYNVGGVVGENSNGAVTNCYNTETVTVTGEYFVGGVVGYNSFNGTVTNCSNSGTVTGSSYNVGGVVGYSSASGTVTNCYNTGTVGGSDYVGGVVGFNSGNGKVTNCYNTGSITGSDYVGGVAGWNGGAVTNCYYLADSEDGNGGKTETQFASGEVAWLLQSGVTEDEDGNVPQIWGQNLDNGKTVDTIPNFTGATVYRASCEDGPIDQYSNTKIDSTAHDWNNGFCSVCGSYQPAVDTNEDGVYEISNAGQLYWFAAVVNEGYGDVEKNASANAILMDNITVNTGVLDSAGKLKGDGSGFREWTPIGSYSNPYTGTFDGDGKTISGLYFNEETNCVGLFGYVGSGGIVKNVGVENSYFTGYYYVGGVVGYNYFGIITSCSNSGTVTGEYSVGGVVGNNNSGTVTNSDNTGSITESGSGACGGVVGSNSGTVTNSYNTETVSGSNNVGGVVGESYGTVTNCYNTGTVTGSYSVGGVVGYNYGNVTNSYNTGSDLVGGVVGENYGTVMNSYYLADSDNGNGGKITAQFASGEVAWLLSQGCTVGGVTYSGEIWGQTLSGDSREAAPVLGGMKVYHGYADCQATDMSYANTVLFDVVNYHQYANGFCSVCDDYQSAVSVTEENYESLELSEEYIGYYAISNAGQLYWFAAVVNEGYGNVAKDTSAKAILMENITVNTDVLKSDGSLNGDGSGSGFREWTPIGSNSNQYTGTFDGGGKTISGLYFNNEETDYVGLFGYVGSGGIVKNVGVANSYFTGDYEVGGVVGFNNSGTVENCTNSGAVTGDYEVGGVVGYNYGTVKNCSNEGAVTGSGDYVGGVVGYNNSGTVTDCENTGAVTGSGDYVGGVVGYNYTDGAVTSCTNEGDVTGSALVGGVVGFNYFGTVTDCENTETVTVSGSYSVGGVVGNNGKGNIEGCTNTGNVTGSSNNVGGVVGYNDYGTVTDCENTGTVSGSYYVGGVVGYNYTETDIGTGAVTKCTNSGAVIGSGNGVGGVVGCNYNGDIANCSNSGNVAGSGSGNNVGGVAGYNYFGIITNCSNSGAVTGSGDYVGGVVGYNNSGTVTNCSNEGTVTGSGNNVGGVAGYSSASGTVTNCYNTGTVSGIKFVGGVVGWNEKGEIANCSNEGDVTGSGDYVGGVVGYNKSGTVTDCSNSGAVSGSYYVGGVVGYNDYGTVTNCSNSGAVSGSNTVGGVAGCNYGTVTSCSNSGAVTGSGNTVGGVVGNNEGTVENCTNSGAVTGSGNTVGGVVGYSSASGTVTNCYNTGTVSGSGNTVGGVVGYNYGTVTNCYYNNAVYSGKAFGESYGTVDNLTGGKNETQFASGEVAWLLQSGVTADEDGNVPQIWGQNLDNGETVDTIPNFTGATVYRGKCADTWFDQFSNTEINYTAHDWSDGTCTNCGTACGHTSYNNGVCTVCGTACEHTSYDNGFCTVCGVYQSAVKVTSTNYQELGVDAEYVGYYAIYNAGQLYWFAAVVNKGYGDVAKDASANAILMDNITVNTGVLDSEGNLSGDGSGFRKWTPIGSNSNPYTGTFDGDGHTISGLYFNESSTDYVGLFGFVGGTVQNVGVVDSYFYGEDSVGGVAGYSSDSGTVTNCYNTGTVSGSYYVGGVVGWNEATVTNCYNSGAVTGNEEVGGVVGVNPYGTVTNCYYNNAVYSGNAVGWNEGTVDNLTGGKNETQFASGEVAWLLSQGCTVGGVTYSGEIWGQNLDNGETVDTIPNFTGATVYRVTNCKEKHAYSNTNEPIDHNWEDGKCTICGSACGHTSCENGFCTVCGGYESAVFVTEENYASLNLSEDYIGYYAIYNAGQLYWFAAVVNEGYGDVEKNASANAILMENITVNTGVLDSEGNLSEDVSGFREWTPMYYRGAFEGNGKTISGLYFNNLETEYVGLFGYVGIGGIVINVGVENSYFKGYSSVGGVVGESDGIVVNCSNTGTVIGFEYVGGVVGYNTAYENEYDEIITGIITNCSNEGCVFGNEYVGGVVGYNNYGEIANCTNSGAVTGSYEVGGVVGYNDSGAVTECTNTVTGAVTGSYDVGGVVGYNNCGEIAECDNYSTVSGVSTDGDDGWIGGVVGYNNYGIVTYCTNSGAVTGNDYVGGVVGYNHYGEIAECDNTGTVIGYYNVGGVVGYNHYGEIAECDNSGKVTGSYNVGGVVGWNEGTVANCTNYSTVSGVSTDGDDGWIGGVVGYNNYGEIANCTNSGAVTGGYAVGGVVGSNYDGSITNCTNSGAVTGTDDYVGGVVGESRNGKIANCSNEGDVTGTEAVGGVVGDNYYYGEIADCANSGKVTGTEAVGGVVGNNDSGVVTNCYNTGAVTGTEAVGGVVGYTDSGAVTECTNTITGTVTGTKAVGGVVGDNDYGSITYCTNEGDVTGDNNRIGGVVGANDGTVTDCYNTGDVTGADSVSKYIGGVAGNNDGTVEACYNEGTVIGYLTVGGVVGNNDSGVVTNCYNTGAVTGTGENVGGVVGYNYTETDNDDGIGIGTVTNCYNTGNVSGTGDYVGGVVGNNEATVTNCYYLADSEDENGGKTETQFASGEVAWLLQSGVTADEDGNVPQIWGQNLDNGETVDTIPNFTGATVYQVTNCKEEPAYSNTNEPIDHNWEDGKCTVCGTTCGHTSYENGICTVCGASEELAYITSYSITLRGNIGINFYAYISDTVLEDEEAYVLITYADGETEKLPVSEATANTYGYKFTARVAAKEMTDTITAQIFYTGGNSKEVSCSVKSYADYVLQNSGDEKLKELVEAMLVYGAAAQMEFSYNTENPAVDSFPDLSGVTADTLSDFNVEYGQGTDQVKFYAPSLVLKSETTLRFYFTAEAEFTAKLNGEDLTVTKNGSYYCVDITNISAKNLDETYTLVIDDGTSTAEVSCSPLAYGYLTLKNSGSDDALCNVVRALYLYNQAANDYFG